MKLNVAFKKRLGPWIYQFDIIVIHEDGTPMGNIQQASKLGSAIVGGPNSGFEVVVMLPDMLEKNIEKIKRQCLELHRKLGEIIEI